MEARNSLKGKVVIVAGGAKNLGGSISRALALEAVEAITIHFNSDATLAAAKETASYVEAQGVKTLLLQAELTSTSQVVKLFQDTKDKFGRIDVAINTTGLVLKKPLIDVTEEEYDQSFDINSKTAFFFLREAGKQLNDGGKICTIVTSLLGAFTGYYSVYAGSKAPVEHFTRAAAQELGKRGISVTAVAPGPMETPFFYGQETAESAAYLQSAAALSPFTQTGLTDVKDIVPLVKFLVSDGWWITGQTILANGGFTTK